MSQDEFSLRILAARADASLPEGKAARLTARTGEMKVAQLFGESDEEKAARQQHEQTQDSSIAALNQRLQELSDVEDSLRRLTGQVEQLDHRLTELNDRITRVQKEFDYKLCALAAQQLGASSDSGDQTALPCNGVGQQTGTPPPGGGGAPPPASGGPIHLAPPPGVLGTIPRSDLGNLPQGPQSSQNQLASIDTRPQFESALNMLAKAQYDEARAAFRGFADTYPRDDLAPQAVYWVGDIAYVQKDYAGAARAFAEELKKYPASPRAPESMLKLGQSLIAMNQKKEGCTALGALASRYPTASKSVADQALTARKAAGCR
ncbi:MAG TPA: tol-pal system protein YbgF [Rhizomicrobium sp.]|nr:tol-pal system protein YbgF [Rhizomicrobium sp.]